MGLRRAFSLTFRAGLYPLSGRRRADRQPSDPLAAAAGAGGRIPVSECRIGATPAGTIDSKKADLEAGRASFGDAQLAANADALERETAGKDGQLAEQERDLGESVEAIDARIKRLFSMTRLLSRMISASRACLTC
jgi:hypothetical protein